VTTRAIKQRHSTGSQHALCSRSRPSGGNWTANNVSKILFTYLIIFCKNVFLRHSGLGCTVTEGRLIPDGGQIFRNSNLTGSFPMPTSVTDWAATHLAHIVCSALLYFQIKAAPGTF
jgi:hypothetical protein